MKFGLFYQLPCAPEQDPTTRYQQTLEQIRYADQLGFDTAWLAELHFNPNFSIMPAPLVLPQSLPSTPAAFGWARRSPCYRSSIRCGPLRRRPWSMC